MRNQIELTDDQILSRFRSETDSIEDLVFTAESIDDFRKARLSYADGGSAITDRADELELDGVRVTRGQQKKTLHVVDFGDVRAVYCL